MGRTNHIMHLTGVVNRSSYGLKYKTAGHCSMRVIRAASAAPTAVKGDRSEWSRHDNCRIKYWPARDHTTVSLYLQPVRMGWSPRTKICQYNYCPSPVLLLSSPLSWTVISWMKGSSTSTIATTYKNRAWTVLKFLNTIKVVGKVPLEYDSKLRETRQPSRHSDSLRTGRSGGPIPVRGEIFRTRPDRP